MATLFLKIVREHRTGRKVLLLLPGIVVYYLLNAGIIENTHIVNISTRMILSYMVIISIMIFNSILLGFLDIYSHTDKSRSRPLKGLVQGIQVALYFIGGIVIVAILIDKSPAALLTGLGASAAVLMLIFKDSILGFVAGVQLSRNNMIRIGDWIQMPDGSADGTIEEISLNTVKVRNWDNTITTIPPYTLISSPFRNWRGMLESGGRRVSRKLYLDIRTIRACSKESAERMLERIPLIRGIDIDRYNTLNNSLLYRLYVDEYIHSHPLVAHGLDIIIAQRQPGEFGLPIEIYFFLTEKRWREFEKIQSDIFDHLITMASEFGLKIYQLPTSIFQKQSARQPLP